MECATKLPEGDQKASEVKTVKTISGNLVVVLECHEIKESHWHCLPGIHTSRARDEKNRSGRMKSGYDIVQTT